MIANKYIFSFSLLIVIFSSSCSTSTIIDSQPSGADIYVGRVYKGVTPYKYSTNSNNDKKLFLMLEKEGYNELDTFLIRKRDGKKNNFNDILAHIFVISFDFNYTLKPKYVFNLTQFDKNTIQPKKGEIRSLTNSKGEKLELLRAKYNRREISKNEFFEQKRKILNDEM